MNQFEFAVPCLFGLEGIAGDELRRLHLENVRVENGRVLFSGDENDSPCHDQNDYSTNGSAQVGVNTFHTHFCQNRCECCEDRGKKCK